MKNNTVGERASDSEAPPQAAASVRNICRWQREYQNSLPKKPKIPDPALTRELAHGWILSFLGPLEALLWGRWQYWARVQIAPDLPREETGFHLGGDHQLLLPTDGIPRIEFAGTLHPLVRGMLTRCLNAVAGEHPSGDEWMGWSSFSNFDYFLDWLLFALGHEGHPELPREPSPGASMRLFQLFDLTPLLLWSHDGLGQLLAECQHGRANGFFPTPHSVCELLTLVNGNGDHRLEKTCDPTCGSGRMLLHASNVSLRLFGQDIDATMCKTTLVNGYLFAPWLAKPIWWLDDATLLRGNSLSLEPGEPVNGAAPCQCGNPDCGNEMARLWRQGDALLRALRQPHQAQGQNNSSNDRNSEHIASTPCVARTQPEGKNGAPSPLDLESEEASIDVEASRLSAPILKRRASTRAKQCEGQLELALNDSLS